MRRQEIRFVSVRLGPSGFREVQKFFSKIFQIQIASGIKQVEVFKKYFLQLSLGVMHIWMHIKEVLKGC